MYFGFVRVRTLSKPHPIFTRHTNRRPALWLSPRWLLACLSLAAIVQGMIFTNVVISSIERRFGLHSTQSGIIAGKETSIHHV